MDNVVTYRHYIQQLLDEDQHQVPSYGDIHREAIRDAVQDHYQLLSIGWHNQQRIHACIWHVDIRDGKIWIQQDGTEESIADRLVARGVPKTAIVLGYQSPFKRQFTEFAVE